MGPSNYGSQTERVILFLADDWTDFDDGIAGINRSLCRKLASHKGVKVYSTLLLRMDEISEEMREDAEKMNVTLLHPSTRPNDNESAAPWINDHKLFDDSPQSLFPNLSHILPSVTHIIGHSPISAHAALNLRDNLYTKSKVILFYHIIPADIAWLQDNLPFDVPSDTELVELADRADMVYSVTSKLHWYFSAKFRNRATTSVDHRRFIPQCSEKTFILPRKVDSLDSVRTNYSLSTLSTLSTHHGPPSDGEDQVFTILAFAHNINSMHWDGLDIAACCANKIAMALSKYSGIRRRTRLIVACRPGYPMKPIKMIVFSLATHTDMVVDFSVTRCLSDLLELLADSDLCLVPSRAEPYGAMGFVALSSGVPTLVSESSAVASVIERLTSEPESYLVPVTPSVSTVRQDASVWRDQVLALLQDMQGTRNRAHRIKVALRRDEPTKETFDNVATYCLGGIRLRHQVVHVATDGERNESRELYVQRALDTLISDVMKQCWRLKHHPLTKKDDLYPLVPGADLPVGTIMKKVTNKIEEYGRRIVGYEEDSHSFIVYCPTSEALSDLWAMCDVINNSLLAYLLVGQNNPILHHYNIKAASMKTTILGPEFLQYKDDLVRHSRPKTAAF